MKTINDYMREHSGGSSIDYNAMLDEINRLIEDKNKFDEECRRYIELRDEVMEENQRLRKALEFYADKSNWVSRTGRIGTSPIDLIDREACSSDEYPWAGGKIARQALGGGE